MPSSYSLPSGRPACTACGLRLADCICAELPRLELGLELHLVVHVGELVRQSNTGRIAHRVFTGSNLHVIGRADQPIDWEPLRADDRPFHVLWPSPRARTAGPELLAEGAAVVVPDGSWRQTRRMLVRNPVLHDMRPLALPPGPAPRWAARRSPGAGRYCTLEALILLAEAVGHAGATAPLWDALAEVECRLMRQRGKPVNAAASRPRRGGRPG
ncbi:MAG: DTW domain-containing protein [Planctomycetota bacterium]